MGLNSFTIKEPRSLPVFLLIDASGSMKGTKIEQVNLAIQEMMHALSEVQGARGQIKVAMIRIGQDVEVIQPLEKVKSIVPPRFEAQGKTPIGQSLQVVMDMMLDETTIPKRDYEPIVILISDGIPTDITREMHENRPITMDVYKKWAPMQALHEHPKTSKAMKLALGIGEDAEYAMLKVFVNNKQIPVIQAKNVTTISRFFQWVTRTVSEKSKSVNPNAFDGIPFEDIFFEDELL